MRTSSVARIASLVATLAAVGTSGCTVVTTQNNAEAGATNGTTGSTGTTATAGTTGTTGTTSTAGTTSSTGTTGTAGTTSSTGDAGTTRDASVDASVEAGGDGSTVPSGRAHCWSGGDPHIITFDGLKYDFQAVGEFVLMTEQGNTVQVRQAPWPGSRSVAMNTAVATRLGTSRVGIYAGAVAAATPMLRIDGTPTILTATQSLGGGSISLTGNVYTIRYANGATLAVELAGDHLDLDVTSATGGGAGTVGDSGAIADASSSGPKGLCGDIDGTVANDFTLANGGTLAQPLSHADLYTTFASSWRVLQADSLFDYGTGESTTTFTDVGFPYAASSSSTITGAQYTAAYAICTAAGVTDVALLNACVLDVAITGANGFTTFAQHAKKPGASAYVSYYTNDFEGTIGGEWSSSMVASAPGTAGRGATKFLGAFVDQTVTLTLANLPAHDRIDLAFDLYVMGGWQGVATPSTPHEWSLGLSTGETLAQTTFSNGPGTQSFPDLYPGTVEHPAQTGALVTNALGIAATADSIYHLKYSFLHLTDTLALRFSAANIPAGATWGVDNIDLSLTASPGVSHEDIGEGGVTIHVVHGAKGPPAVVGCSDGQREAFIDQTRYPNIAGCLASWAGNQSMRDASSGVPCGDSIGTCTTPASACATGWHTCGSSGALSDLRAITPDQCESAGGGRYVAAVSHCADQNGCDYNAAAGATYACYATGFCSESVCCGSECTQYGVCADGIWVGRTHIAEGTDQGCGAISSQRAGGVLCCK